MRRPARQPPSNHTSPWPESYSHLGLLLAIAITLARCTFLEYLRPLGVAPGSEPSPVAPGAATSLWLDLLCLLPALLVLLRRTVDRSYRLRFGWPMLAALPLGVWMLASSYWADDKFACIVSAANFCAALAIFWAAGQLVDRWLRLRLVAATAVALLGAYLFQGFSYHFDEAPRMREYYQKMHQHDPKPTDFIAIQLEKKIMSGEVMGFSASANSFGALLVLVMVITTGLAVQRFADGDDPPWGIMPALLVAAGLWLLFYTKSKAAIISPALAAALLVAVWRFGPALVRHARAAFFAGVAMVVLVFIAIIAHGLVRHKLPTDSLNFRWRYWVASWPLFWQHPFVGVGWSNFGRHYLHFRLPQASEEIQDPHNFLIRFFVELGMVGGVLALAWTLSLWYAITRPMLPAGELKNSPKPQRGFSISSQLLREILAVAALAIGINILASLDFNQDVNYLIWELTKRGITMGLFVAGLLLAGVRWLAQSRLDDRPAPWVLRCIIVALAVFLIHNLIDFSLFEPGATCLFCLLAGSAVGIRQSARPIQAKPRHLLAMVGVLAGVSAIGLIAIIRLVIPVSEAECYAHDGDEALRKGNITAAAANYRRAWQTAPYNADYIFRTGQALMSRPEPWPAHWQDPILDAFNQAIAADPSVPAYFLHRAHVESQLKDDAHADADYLAALQIDPNDVATRLNYAELLLAQNHPGQARHQFALALQYNDGLDQAEPKRLPPEQVEKIKKQIEQLPE